MTLEGCPDAPFLDWQGVQVPRQPGRPGTENAPTAEKGVKPSSVDGVLPAPALSSVDVITPFLRQVLMMFLAWPIVASSVDVVG